MKTLVPCLLALLILGTGGALAASSAPVDGGISSGPPDEVFVDTAEIVALESFPVQVRLLVRGSLPTPCHRIETSVESFDDRILVSLWSVPGEGLCATVLEPFEVSIPLGTFGAANLPVLLNGEEIGRVVVGSPEASGDGLTGAGWSFGMCMGYCRADLAIDGDEVVVTGSDRSGQVTLYTNRGTLTSAGRERLDAAVAALSGVPLEDVYGCPDCADGGATYLTISRDGVATHHEMEYGEPPAELADVHELAMSLMASLEACVSDDQVSVAPDCQAWQSGA